MGRRAFEVEDTSRETLGRQVELGCWEQRPPGGCCQGLLVCMLCSRELCVHHGREYVCSLLGKARCRHTVGPQALSAQQRTGSDGHRKNASAQPQLQSIDYDYGHCRLVK